MPVNYMSFDDAKATDGLKMVVNQGIPSPWSEAAKGILHVKNIPWSAIYFDPFNIELQKWSGSRSAPALRMDEQSISDWQEILNFAEAYETSPSLLPDDRSERERVMEISTLICGEDGLGWTRRLENVHRSLSGQGGEFPEQIANYIGQKYGYEQHTGADYSERVVERLGQLADILKAQRDNGSRYYVGSALTAADIYSATFMGIMQPLPEEQCAMIPMVRGVFSHLSEEIEQALDPILLAHRDYIYERYLELPLSL